MNMEIHIKLIGYFLLLLALIHLIFPRYFHWKKELKTLSLINRQMMLIHTFFIALTVFLMGLLCVFYARDLIGTNLGRSISFGLGIFWSCRLFIQFFGYSSELWKGKKFETVIHVLFVFIWTYLSVVFLLASWKH
jgi:hypothetical protein